MLRYFHLTHEAPLPMSGQRGHTTERETTMEHDYSLPPTQTVTEYAPCPICGKAEFRAVAHRTNHVAKCARVAGVDQEETSVYIYADGAHRQTVAEAAAYRPSRARKTDREAMVTCPSCDGHGGALGVIGGMYGSGEDEEWIACETCEGDRVVTRVCRMALLIGGRA